MLQHFITIILILTKKRLMKITMKLLIDETNTYSPRQFKIKSSLPEWLGSKNDFNEAKKLIDDIEVDINKVKASRG